MLKKRIVFILSALIALALWSCGNDIPDPTLPDEQETPAEPTVEVSPRTVLVYMVADNSLGRGGYDRQDLDQMHEGVDAGALDGGGRLIVYYNRRGTSAENPPLLVEIKPGVAEEVVLKEYPEDGSVYSTDEERMRQVIDDVLEIAPSEDFGLVLWSHATGWIQEDEARKPILRSYGQDRDRRMAISTLARVLDDVRPSFIYFDCCLMATVEVAYELRHSTPVIVASGAEVHGDGMPYHLALSDIFADGPADMVKTAKTVFDFYNARDGADRWCTISVIDTSRLDALADAARDIMSAGPVLAKDVFQRYSPSKRYRIYDMADYFGAMDNIPEAAAGRFRQALDNVIVYRANTPYVNGTHRIDTYCGMGCNIVTGATDATAGNYNLTSWWRDVASHNPLFQKQ